jgi:hypothetical protein
MIFWPVIFCAKPPSARIDDNLCTGQRPRQNNTTHVLGNELLKDLDLLSGVVFL